MECKSKSSPSSTETELFTEKELPFCGICSVQFTCKKSFDTHYVQNHSEERLMCGNCNKSFSSKYLFEKHSKKRKCKKKRKNSADCDDLQKSVGNDLSNFKKRTGEKQFECRLCKRSFSSNSFLLIHIQKHFGDKKYVCHICQKNFLQKVYLKRHLRTHTGERPYTCEICFRCFGERAQLNIHNLIHTGEMPYSCSKRFRHVGTLKYHRFFVHTEAGRLQLLKCDVCGTRFKERRALLRHQLRHKKELKPNLTHIDDSLSQDDVKLACGSNNDDLKSQDCTHPEHKPYVCHICQQCFSNENSFQEHNATHTNNAISVVPLSSSCVLGGENLQLDYPNDIGKRFICEVCDEQFDDSDGLKIHFKLHTEHKYYVCEVCQLCFIDEEALRNHVNIEKCVYFHTCKICGEKFVNKIELETHCVTHVGFPNEISSSYCLKVSDLGQHCNTSFNADLPINLQERSSNFIENRSEIVYNDVKDLPYNSETFANESDLKLCNVRYNEKTPHICVLCLKRFDKRSELKAHVCKHDNSENKSILYRALKSTHLKGFICSLCLKCFIHFHPFQHHMLEHDKQYECKTCGKHFFTADSLEAHRLQSHKPPMHPCIVCKEKFVDKNDLIAHCFSHLGAGEYFICGLCKQCFKGRENLEKHTPCFAKTRTT